MKKFLSVIILLSCIVTSMFALTAEIIENKLDGYRAIYVYEDQNPLLDRHYPKLLLVYSRSLFNEPCSQPLASLYAISWYRKGATVEEIKEWKEFAKFFVEEDIK